MEGDQQTDKPVKQEKSGAASKRSKASGPEETGTATARKQFDIDIFGGWCKSCGICAAFCPRECIRMDEQGSPKISDSGRCTGCGWCELHCPDFAISVREKSEKAPTENI